MSDTPRTDAARVERSRLTGGQETTVISYHVGEALERELAHQTARADEAVRRLQIYADREEAKEIRRLRDIIAGQTAELERLRDGAACPDWLLRS